jgi:hypothetical protein
MNLDAYRIDTEHLHSASERMPEPMRKIYSENCKLVDAYKSLLKETYDLELERVWKVDWARCLKNARKIIEDFRQVERNCNWNESANTKRHRVRCVRSSPRGAMACSIEPSSGPCKGGA